MSKILKNDEGGIGKPNVVEIFTNLLGKYDDVNATIRKFLQKFRLFKK